MIAEQIEIKSWDSKWGKKETIIIVTCNDCGKLLDIVRVEKSKVEKCCFGALCFQCGKKQVEERR